MAVLHLYMVFVHIMVLLRIIAFQIYVCLLHGDFYFHSFSNTKQIFVAQQIEDNTFVVNCACIFPNLQFRRSFCKMKVTTGFVCLLLDYVSRKITLQ